MGSVMHSTIKKPANLIYGVADIPPMRVALLLALQHTILALGFIVYPLILVSESGAAPAAAEGVVTAAILLMAIGTFLQCLGRKGIGCGYLVVNILNPVYLPACIMAAKMGGLGLVFGMLVFSGIFVMLLSRFFRYLRPLFPAEVCGVSVLMLGISLINPAVTRVLGLQGNLIDPSSCAVALITLTLMVVLSVWPKGHIRLYSVLIGLAAGYTAALCLGVTDPNSLRNVFESGFLAVPALSVPKWQVEWTLLLPFVLTALVAVLDAAAGIIICQKISNANWARPDMKNIGHGIMAEGIGTIMASLFGTMAPGYSSAHIALSSTTGATSRSVGLMTAGALLAMAFVPPVAKLFCHMPAPVIGAVLLYAAAFLITSGIELVTSRMLDSRRIFTVGGSIILGLAAGQFLEVTQQLPPWLASVMGSPMAVASLAAILLNLVFRIGIVKNKSLIIEPQIANLANVTDFLDSSGAAWGARRMVIAQAQAGVNEVLETVILSGRALGPIELQARFDEYHLDITLLYEGQPFPVHEQHPTPEQLLADEAAALRLSAAIIRHCADKVVFDTVKGKQRISLHFEN